MQYIGMDTHISNLDFAVVNEAGRLMKATSVATSVKNFMEFVRKVPPPRNLGHHSITRWWFQHTVMLGNGKKSGLVP